MIHDLIVAASYDSTEEAAADSRFAEMFSASAFPDQTGGALIPPCNVVIARNSSGSSDIISEPAWTDKPGDAVALRCQKGEVVRSIANPAGASS